MGGNQAEERINRHQWARLLPRVVCRLMMMLRNPTQENEEVVEVLPH